MNKPDIAALAHKVKAIRAGLSELDDLINVAYEAALGEYDPATEGSVEGTESGDDASYFESMKSKVGDARVALLHVEESAATVQGWREFEAIGVAP